ncbi:MAG: hypothetical protein SNJ69_09055, partial [Chloroflexaceae bacterium]
PAPEQHASAWRMLRPDPAPARRHAGVAGRLEARSRKAAACARGQCRGNTPARGACFGPTPPRPDGTPG